MTDYRQLAAEAYTGYAHYLWQEITTPHWRNYFWWLVGVSAFFMVLEWLRPWRKDQPRFRKGFWLDAFYMFFNFFLFSLIVYNAASTVAVALFREGLTMLGIEQLQVLRKGVLPVWAVLLVGFIVRDFVQWWVHRLLHAVPWLWEFHKVHHSVEQMGFAAHLRYHWMETVVYRTLEYLPLALLGLELYDFFIIHLFTLAVGHFNHANIYVPLGPLRYVFNNPQLHTWHHAYALPERYPRGVNFAITLSVWDYLFGTAYEPYAQTAGDVPTGDAPAGDTQAGRDERLGFPGIEQFPQGFVGQATQGLRRPAQSAA